MRRRAFLLLPTILMVLHSTHLRAWPLVTDEEARRSQSEGGQREAATEPVSDAPTIEVEEPKEGTLIGNPVTVRIKFHASIGSVIQPKTFRVTYGWFAIDITDRILQHAIISADGLSADGA